MKKILIPLSLLCACSGPGYLYAQAPATALVQPVAKVGELRLDLSSLRASDLLAQLQSNVFTDLSVELDGVSRTFRMSLSDKVELSGGQDIAYSGYERSSHDNYAFFILSEASAYLSFRVGDKEYTIMPTHMLRETSYFKDASSAVQARGVATLAGVSDEGQYSLVDKNRLNKWMSDNYEATASAHSESERSCRTEAAPEAGTAAKVYEDDFLRRPGYIGKRDMFVHLYRFHSSISDGDYNEVVNRLVQKVLSGSRDARWKDVRVVVIEHKRGKTSNKIVDEENMPWTNNPYSFLYGFIDRAMHDTKANECQLCLTKYGWSSTDGVGDCPGIYGIAVVYDGERLNYTVPSHEFSHNLNAVHSQAFIYSEGVYYQDLMNVNLFLDPQVAPRLESHYDENNITAINDNISLRSIKNEILDSSFTPVVHNWNYAEDIVTVSDNTGTTTMNPEPYGILFQGQESRVSLVDSSKFSNLKVYAVQVPTQPGHNQTYLQMRITAADYDTYLYVLDENGNLVASDDDGGSALGYGLSYLSGYFNAGKTYYVIVGGYLNKPGNFKLKVRYGWWNQGWKPVPGQAPDLSPAPAKLGMLEAADGSFIDNADFGICEKRSLESPDHTGTVLTAASSDLAVYPNPAKGGMLTIRQQELSEGDNYRIRNMAGQVVQEGVLRGVSGHTATIRISSGISGVYQLQVQHGGKAASCKFVIE